MAKAAKTVKKAIVPPSDTKDVKEVKEVKELKEFKELKEGTPKIFVRGLPQDCTKAEIRNFFSEFGKVIDVLYKYGADTSRIKGLAFVLFKDQETADKLIEKKIIEMEDHKLEIRKPKEEGRNKDELHLNVPKEALKCYVCKKTSFPSSDAFFHHKQGKQHQVLLKMFRAKSTSILQLLRAESKLASDRLYDIKWIKANPNKESSYCDVCQVHINYNPSRHEKSAEHKMVLSYINKKCCDIEFTDRFKYENHLFSLKHLKNAYEKEEQSKLDKGEERLTMKKAIDIYKQCDQDLKELKEKYPDLDLNEEIPPFTGQPIGLNHIVKKINYYCICCDQKFFPNVQFVKPHCRSYNHYTNMVDLIKDLEVDFRKKRREEKINKKKEDLDNIKIEKREREDSKETTDESAPKKIKIEVKAEIKKEEKDDHDDDDYEMPEEEDAENEEEEEEEGGNDEEQQEPEEQEEMEAEENMPEDEVGEEQSKEEVVEESEVQPEADDEDKDQAAEPEDSKAEEDAPVEEEKEEEEEEEEVVVPKPKATRGRRGRGRGARLRR